VKLINENMYLYGRGKISPLEQESLVLTPAIILMNIFCNVNIFLLLCEIPQRIIPN
jgi:hypothetical protein